MQGRAGRAPWWAGWTPVGWGVWEAFTHKSHLRGSCFCSHHSLSLHLLGTLRSPTPEALPPLAFAYAICSTWSSLLPLSSWLIPSLPSGLGLGALPPGRPPVLPTHLLGIWNPWSKKKSNKPWYVPSSLRWKSTFSSSSDFPDQAKQAFSSYLTD